MEGRLTSEISWTRETLCRWRDSIVRAVAERSRRSQKSDFSFQLSAFQRFLLVFSGLLFYGLTSR